MISINTNYGGLFASKAASSSQNLMDTAMERLSTGKRINYASDDAAGQGIATRLTGEIQGLEMASKNAADAQSMIDTAEGALQEVHDLLLRMRELAVQSANDTVTTSDRTAMQAEVQALENEIQRVGDNTTWGGQKILDGHSYSTGSKAKFQIGVDAGESIDVNFGHLSVTGALSGEGNLGLTGDVNTQTNASSYITDIDKAISVISTRRGDLGAISNRLTSTMSNLDQIKVNLSASRGRIEDTDFAAETGNLAKSQILQQAATAMLAQANASKQTVLTLVR